MADVKFVSSTSILRSLDEAKAREFYVDFLEFEIEFEHRFEPGLPLYLGLKFGACRLHITEHHGDAVPGGRVRIEVQGLVEYAKKLNAKNYKYARPGMPIRAPWGELDLTVTDPFGNNINFYERSA